MFAIATHAETAALILRQYGSKGVTGARHFPLDIFPSDIFSRTILPADVSPALFVSSQFS